MRKIKLDLENGKTITGIYNEDIINCPENYNRYSLRHGDDDSDILSIELNVIVNRYGYLYTKHNLELKFNELNIIEVIDWEFYENEIN